MSDKAPTLKDRPCPYCGSAPGALTLDDSAGQYRVICSACGTRGNLADKAADAYRLFDMKPRPNPFKSRFR